MVDSKEPQISKDSASPSSVDTSQLETSGDPTSSLKLVNEILKSSKYWTSESHIEEAKLEGEQKSDPRYKNTDEVSLSEDLSSSYQDHLSRILIQQQQ